MTAKITICLALVGLLTSCKDKKQVTLPQPILNQPELITTFILNLTDSANQSSKVTATFRDVDGAGGASPSVTDTLRVYSGRTYYASITLLDETKSPVDTLSKEILKEAEDHQFFFSFSGVSIMAVYLDKDVNNLPLGLSTKWVTKSAALGTSKIVLRHQAGTKNGTSGPGETDIEVDFNTKILN